jgi:predicted nucleic acid-binding protein
LHLIDVYCAELLEDLLLHHELVTSAFILGELRRKLVEKFKFPGRDADQVRAFLRRVSIVVEPADLPSDLCRDPTDVPVLDTAVAGACALLISVDRDMQAIRAIPIIRPGEYWRRTAEFGWTTGAETSNRRRNASHRSTIREIALYH